MKTEVRETYYMCCDCGDKFDTKELYIKHAIEKNHKLWVRLFK